jgi:DMSO/TMAO reductase YedYZ molybdopterin-dependent catalytic subunit
MTDQTDVHDPATSAAIDEINALAPSMAIPVSGVAAATSGVLAAGVALGVGELLSGISNKIPSLIIRVGDVVIENSPGSVERWAIDTLGTNDKPALIVGITLISLLLGGLTGIAASKKFTAGVTIFVLFGLLGGLAAGSDPQRPAGWAWFSAILAAAAGTATLYLLLKTVRALPNAAASPDQLANSRRGFLGAAIGAAAVSVAAPVVGTALRSRQSAQVEGDRENVAAALNSIDTPSTGSATSLSAGSGTSLESESAAVPELTSFDDIDGIATLVTPNNNFYRIDSALSVPRIDVETWSMKITGMVDQEIELTFDDLLAMDPVEEFVTLSCVSNNVGGDLVGNARWLGVPIKKLLDMAGVQPGATQIVGRSVDGWTGGFPTEYLNDPDRVALVAVAMNGEPLPTQHGFPVRLVVAGLYGYVSATKWLKEIELTTWDDFDGYWITRGWGKEGPIKTQSRIDVPNANARLDGGGQPIAGVAWAPDRGIAKVEVLITEVLDGEEEPNENWIEAELSGDVTDNSWRQWMLPWSAPTGDHVIRVRATDGQGATQTAERSRVDPDGATGWHTIAVRVS